MRFRYNFTLINPSAQKCVKITYLLFSGCGERVLIKTRRNNGDLKSAVYRAWPLLDDCDSPFSVHLTSLAARNIGFTDDTKIKSRIELRKFDKTLCNAKEVFLTPETENCHKYLDELSFQSVVALACRDTFLAIGSSIVLNYYGQMLELRATQITSAEINNSAETSGIESLVETFKHSISLQHTADSNMVTSTPQKTRVAMDNEGCNHLYVNEETKINIMQMNCQTNNLFLDSAKSSLDRIGGLKNELTRIEESIRSVISSEFRSYVGILLYGPSGTGKTLIGKTIEHFIRDQDVEYIHINGCEIYSKYSGETEAKLRSALEIHNSRTRKVIFIDDFEIICNKPTENAKSTDQDRRICSTLRSIGKYKICILVHNHF